ncbi:PQQ-binding-like beta-propeller repeat protein [Rhodobacterales bacterium HKCCE2091]|nr:PQQ-binding-like beta-propeller repeat protein [Rhodobacterales bacterium HKCCE2091]
MGGIIRNGIIGLAALTTLAACAERDPLLLGQRFGTRVPLAASLPNEAGEYPVAAEVDTDESRPIALGAAVALASWPQRGQNAENRIPNAALPGALTEVFAVDIGQGNQRRARITADPVAGNGRIFTLDSAGLLTATAESGARIWQADLTAGFDRGGGISGGGLALSGGTVYATTAYGELIAVSAESGAVSWRQRLDAGLATPTVADGLVFVVGRDGAAWAIDAQNGRIRWELPALPAPAALTGGAAPAINGGSVILPFASGELVAATRNDGARTWTTAVQGERRGVAYSAINDITGDPVAVGGTVFAGNQSGYVVALDAATGTRRWTAQDGAYSPLLVAGDSVFFVSDRNELIRVESATGTRIWGTELPLFESERIRRRDAVFTHYGPILGGGRLIVASGDGAVRLFDPESGAEIGQLAIRGGAAANPIVVNGTLYVVSADGRLHAYR